MSHTVAPPADKITEPRRDQFPGHSIQWRLMAGDYFPRAEILCEAAPDAICRTYCPQPDCLDEGCLSPATHPRKVHGYCAAMSELEDDGVCEVYDGAETSLRDAPIWVYYDNEDRICWVYAPSPSSNTESGESE